MWMHRYQPILGSRALGISSLSEVRPEQEHARDEFLGTKDILGSMSIVLKCVAICVYASHGTFVRGSKREDVWQRKVIFYIGLIPTV
jgi:hypothetical protein